MTKGTLFGVLLLAGILFCSGAAYAQAMDPGYSVGTAYGPPPPYGGGWNYCPYHGRFRPGWGYGMGPGMMGPGYYGMGPGMMGWGYGYAPPYYAPPWQQEREKPLDKDEAKTTVENYLKWSRNPNLKLGNIEDKGDYFEAEIVTKEGSLVNKLDIDKDSGFMQSVY